MLDVPRAGGTVSLVSQTPVVAYPSVGLGRALMARVRIIFAIMLRQMKIKSGEDRFGYLKEISDPVFIIGMISLLMTVRKATPPVGDSYPLFIATGYLPFKAYSFMSNEVRRAMSKDSGVVGLPAVHQIDALIASITLKLITVILVIIIVVAGMNLIGYRVIPGDPLDLIQAFFWICIFAIGFGLFANSMIELVPTYRWVHKILTFKLLFVSGVLFLPELMPPEMRYYLDFNPLLHAIAWFRSAFIDGFESSVLDRGYFMWWSICLLAAGLVITRVFRNKLTGDTGENYSDDDGF
jgi:capsular polysaccharide transport system permease protein